MQKIIKNFFCVEIWKCPQPPNLKSHKQPELTAICQTILNAEAQKDAPAEKYSNVIINEIKGDAQKVNIMSIINENSNISNEITDLPADFPIDALQDKELIAKFNSIVSDSDKCKFFFDTFRQSCDF